MLAGDTVVWRDHPASTAVIAEDSDVTPVIEARGEHGAWSKIGTADPQLGYFLQAGAVVDAWQGGDSTDVGAP